MNLNNPGQLQDDLPAAEGCECGKRHVIPIKKILVSEDALRKTPEIIKQLTEKKKICIIGDNNTFKAAGNQVSDRLSDAEYKVLRVVLEGEKVEPDMNNVREIIRRLDNDAYLIACGAGSINDLVKYVSGSLNRPYTVIATAPSMDGYTSPVSAITTQGIKKTYEAAAPEAVVADLNVLAAAPYELITAGVGDLLGKVTALLDWQLGRILFKEYFCQRVFSLLKDQLGGLFKLTDRFKGRDKAELKVLIEGLIISGLGMQMVGSSRPASGCEHHVSHFIDMYGLQHEQEVPLHGIKVGAAANYTARLYLRFSQQDFAELRLDDDKGARLSRIRAIYGPAAPAVIDNLDSRWERERLSEKQLRNGEGKIKLAIAALRRYLVDIEKFSAEMGLLEQAARQGIDINLIKESLKYSFEIRNRFTLCTLLHKAGLLESWVEEI